MTRPLVLVTRPAAAGDRLGHFLEERGFDVAAVPTVATEPVPWGGPLDNAAVRLDEYDWIVLTSATGVRALADARERLVGGGLRFATARTKWAVVGPATARALEAAGARPDATPGHARSSEIPAALAAVGPLAGTRVLLARADAADSELPQALAAAGADVDDVVAYRTVEAPPTSLEPLAAILADPQLCAVVVASGSAVRGLLRLAERSGRVAELRAISLVSIGPSTSRAARDLGLDVAAEAESPSPESLAAAVTAVVSSTYVTDRQSLEAIP